jgi:16S rRNA (adenine1518-N6/adenine1519-N6)-dimethyltransferase
MVAPKKSLGQHWLADEPTLARIVNAANINADDTVLEIGPGQGALTNHLVKKAGKVIAVELDRDLAHRLANNPPASNLEVIHGDILKFNLNKLPKNYKVVANIPYYLTGKLLANLSESTNTPYLAVLLLQKEVAERVCATPGQMSILAVAVQLFFEPRLGEVVPATLFDPPPKVDSQILILSRRPEPLFENLDSKAFFKVVKAGFSEKRKKLRSSLAGGLGLGKREADELLESAEINGDLRAQNLSLEQWHHIYTQSKVKDDFKKLALPRA